MIARSENQPGNNPRNVGGAERGRPAATADVSAVGAEYVGSERDVATGTVDVPPATAILPPERPRALRVCPRSYLVLHLVMAFMKLFFGLTQFAIKCSRSRHALGQLSLKVGTKALREAQLRCGYLRELEIYKEALDAVKRGKHAHGNPSSVMVNVRIPIVAGEGMPPASGASA